MPANERVLASMENVTYADFAKMEDNENVFKTFARNTFVHAQNDAGFAFHPVAAVRTSFCENVLETAAKPLLVDASIFASMRKRYSNALLVQVFYFSKIPTETRHLKM